MGSPAIAYLVIVPYHVGRKFVEDLLKAFETPIAAVDVPVPTEHVLIDRQQVSVSSAHVFVQELPDVQRMHSVAVALIASRDNKIDFPSVSL